SWREVRARRSVGQGRRGEEDRPGGPSEVDLNGADDRGRPWEEEEEETRARHLARSRQRRAVRPRTGSEQFFATSCVSIALDASRPAELADPCRGVAWQ